MGFWSSYFQFTRKERNGILVLIFLNIIAWIIYFSLPSFTKSKYSFIQNNIEKEIKQFYELKDSIIQKKRKIKKNVLKDTCLVDINNPTKELLACIGVNEKIAQTWQNYILKGGKFKNIDEIKKLSGMNDSIFHSIKNYLICNIELNHLTRTTKTSKANTKKKLEMIELNSADTNQLKTLTGIGSSFANRIVKYRQRLGGYVKKEQLMEIYGFSENLFNKISPYIYVDIFEVKKININTSDYSTLIQHPYFNKESVKLLLEFRKKQVLFKDKNDLIRNQIFTSEEWERIKWYVEF